MQEGRLPFTGVHTDIHWTRKVSKAYHTIKIEQHKHTVIHSGATPSMDASTPCFITLVGTLPLLLQHKWKLTMVQSKEGMQGIQHQWSACACCQLTVHHHAAENDYKKKEHMRHATL